MASLQALFLLLAAMATQTLAQDPAAPAPAPAPLGPANLTAILEKGGQFTTFLKLLESTKVDNQVVTQLNSSTEGMTVFAPTDNAFMILKTGTINSLNPQRQSELVLGHIIPSYHTLASFQTISNPVRTQNGVSNLIITFVGINQVNVSTGLVETQLDNSIRELFPLAVYQVDAVLLSEELFRADPPANTPAKSDGKMVGNLSAEGPEVDAKGNNSNGGFGVRSMEMGFVVGVGLATIGFLL